MSDESRGVIMVLLKTILKRIKSGRDSGRIEGVNRASVYIGWLGK